jgi:cobalt/nickel transport system permease protein
VTTPILPEWYAQAIPAADLSDAKHSRSGPGQAIRRALAGFAETLAGELASQSRNSTWLSKIDIRARIIGMLALIVAVTCLRSLLALLVIFALSVAIAVSVRLTGRRLARLWLGIPLFSALVVLPATLNLITPGNPALTLWHPGSGAGLGPWSLPDTVTITWNGLLVAARFVLRSLGCLTITLILVSTSDHSALLNGLRRLGVPKVFGMVLGMMQRYLVVLLRVTEELHLAKLSRTISASSIRHEQKWVAAGIGILFRRTHRLAEEVHAAMISRGFDGDIQVKSDRGFRPSDYLFTTIALASAAAIVLLDRIVR